MKGNQLTGRVILDKTSRDMLEYKIRDEIIKEIGASGIGSSELVKLVASGKYTRDFYIR